MIYRADIDGLRCIAVLSVVFYHAGFEAFSGGFLGVDVFFVISGYLITGIIIKEMEAGRFSFLTFLERRVRRILPALLLVLAVTLAFSFKVALPEQLSDISRAALAALFSVSNFWFWSQSGYFSPTVELMPLLHTWSLAVEEQFYLLLPLALILAGRGGLPIRWLLLVGTLLALGVSVWLSNTRPSFSFYLLPARVWELGLGATVASWGLPSRGRVLGAPAISGLGLLLIGFSIFFFDRTMVVPGSVAILPCLGTALVLAAGAREGVVYRALSFAPIVWVGLISYSLYLWHWPIFVLFRLSEARVHISSGAGVGLVVLSVFLAALTWRFVERPCRDRSYEFRTVALGLSAAALVIVIASDLSPKFPPILRRVLGLMFGLMRPAFPVPVWWRTRWA